jgi:hypothetical protein
MVSSQSDLYHVLERFPDLKERIHRNFDKSQKFKMLCKDYRRCAIATQDSSESMRDKAQARKNKYAEKLYGLELDIMYKLYDSIY